MGRLVGRESEKTGRLRGKDKNMIRELQKGQGR